MTSVLPMTDDSQTLPVVRVYSRPGCHLCELLLEELLPAIGANMDLEVLNIEDDERWLQDYAIRIPVVEIAGRFVCQYKLDPVALRSAMKRYSHVNSSS